MVEQQARISAADYLNSRYASVPGMSSHFAAKLAVALIESQAAAGVSGSLAEIGVYEGRFFIAMALAAGETDLCLAIDRFHWPDSAIEARFLGHCRDACIPPANLRVLKSSSGDLTADGVAAALGAPARFVHIDGDHTYAALHHDLGLATVNLAPKGIIFVDDMLHPLYPELTLAVADFLKDNTDFGLAAVVDRESFSAACKFVLCRTSAISDIETWASRHFTAQIYRKRARFCGHKALILRPPETSEHG
jgi:DNA-binding transcriptional LysR family regulator